MTVMDVSGKELAPGHVVSCPLPGSGEEVRGYVVLTDVVLSTLRIHLTAPTRLAGNVIETRSADCTLQHGPNGHPLRMREAPGRESGFAEVEAA